MQIDYSSKDYDGFRQSLIDAIPSRLPEWTNRSASDPGIVLIELFAYMGDILSYYGDRIANEAFLSTATQRRSVLDIARDIDYLPHGTKAASAELTFTTASAVGTITIPKHTIVATSSVEAAASGSEVVYFTTDADLVIDTANATQGTVTATEGERILNEVIGESDGTPQQRFSLFHPNVVDGTVVIYVNEGSGPVAWSHYTHLLDANANDQAYTLETDEDNIVTVIFGDDANGRIPGLTSTITADYRIGQGVAGNVGANTIVEFDSPITNVNTVTNPNGATGGADPESVASIRRNAPRSLRSLNRAVTLADFENLAIQSGYVSKAKAVSNVYTNVVLYVAPLTKGNVSTTNKAALQNYFTTKKLLGTDVVLTNPTFVGVDITISVTVQPTHVQGTVEMGVQNALADLLAYENQTFGQRVSMVDVMTTVAAVPGVLTFTVDVLRRGSEVALIAEDVVANAHEILEKETITVNTSGGIV